MGNYRLVVATRNDYKDIGRYTQRQWGKAQRDTYLDQLGRTFQRLADNPNLGRARPEIRPDLRSFICKRHVIFHRPASKGIVILRILHHARDVRKVF